MERPEQTGTQRDARRHMFLIYDAKSGDVVHGHKVLVLPYGDAPSEKELEVEALEVAAQVTGRSAGELKTLAVAEDELQPGATFRVDPGSGRLEQSSREKGPEERTGG